MLAKLPQGDWLQLPTVCEQATLEMIHAMVCEFAGRLGGVVLDSVGQLGMDWTVPYAAGAGIPVMNRRAAAFLLEQGCQFVTASQELSGTELAVLTEGRSGIVVPVWGRVRLMLLHHCPARTAMGLRSGHRDCRMCDENAPDCLRGQCLTDRMGYRFPLQRLRLPEGCLAELLNARVTDITEPARKAGFVPMVSLTGPDGEKTSGHWNRPVE